jgi:hypothetical protein
MQVNPVVYKAKKRDARIMKNNNKVKQERAKQRGRRSRHITEKTEKSMHITRIRKIHY